MDSTKSFKIYEKKKHKSKRYKSSGDSSFNTRESGKGSFSLNNTPWDEEDEVHEVRPSRPMGWDQAKRKWKAGTSSASSTTGFNVKSLAKLMMKKMEWDLKVAELEIRRMDQRQKNEALYLSTTDEELKTEFPDLVPVPYRISGPDFFSTLFRSPGTVPYTGNRYGTGTVPVRFRDSGQNAHPYL
ncbi:hypothetical protein Tco_0700112 [Tanacetum coccineum]